MFKMENHHEEKEINEKRNLNTEYLPTKCRITKPPPPKPATNPLQFIKVAPSALYRKAQEQIKKVEEIKSTRQEVREDAEDWQQNLDNWKSSRRKRQEHIIERVVEVKKFGQEENERNRRKSKTFNEMIEDRSKGRHKFNIPIYTDDDSNDLSDFGISKIDSKVNNFTGNGDDNNTSESNIYESSVKNKKSNQSQNEDKVNNLPNLNSKDEVKPVASILKSLPSNFHTTSENKTLNSLLFNGNNVEDGTKIIVEDTKEYTYEGAIEDYRSRIKSKINVDESIFTRPTRQNILKNKEYTEAQIIVPKGEIFKRKELFEIDKPIEINDCESNTTKRLTDDFINTQSIKQRLQSLEKCTDQAFKSGIDKNELTIGSVKEKLRNFHKKNDNKNNNYGVFSTSISNYILEKSNNQTGYEIKSITDDLNWKQQKDEASDRSLSPEAEFYMNKFNMFNRDFSNLMYVKMPHNMDTSVDDYYSNANYPPSTSSIDLLCGSSDREDSGIHTADVSCSVSQADEPVEDTDMSSNTIPVCIEKLKNNNKNEQNISEIIENNKTADCNDNKNIFVSREPVNNEIKEVKYLIDVSIKFLNSERIFASDDLKNYNYNAEVNNKSVIYENVQVKPLNITDNSCIAIDSSCITIDLFNNPPKTVEPPKVKPPPPPTPQDDEKPSVKPSANIKRLNSTKRIKKEIHLKRSSFLGLDEPTDEQIDPDIPIDRPPDVNMFLQNESKLEKTLYKKMQESQEDELSKVESQDSGLDIDRGRLSSDTWCSSIGDSSHCRQDSEPTNSTISEEDEITKKEREIIEMVEKEEKSRDSSEQNTVQQDPALTTNVYESSSRIDNKKDHYSSLDLDIRDSEVLKVEHELLQLEKEELKRQRENLLFHESYTKGKFQNDRHSLENIRENIDVFPRYMERMNYRKSMPELQMMPNDNCKNTSSSLPNNYYKLTTHVDVLCRKSTVENDLCQPFDHRKSMPELQDVQRSPCRSTLVNRQPIMPGKPLKPLVKEQHKDRFGVELDITVNKETHPLSRHSLQSLSAAPRQRHVPNDNWIQPRAAHSETRNYNQHWLCQEAELRRISEQQKNNLPNRNWLQSRQEKHIPDAVIQSLTQRVQNRAGLIDRNPLFKRSENNSKDYMQRPYMSNKQTLGHALPVSYPPPIVTDDSQDRVLSVSGKKKCSYCGNELGRGAAMIIESLCLFYHMECFKCCVCHMQLSDGMMGTDVRVRNQKLHCHNCYSSDDGVKFSCV